MERLAVAGGATLVRIELSGDGAYLYWQAIKVRDLAERPSAPATLPTQLRKVVP